MLKPESEPQKAEICDFQGGGALITQLPLPVKPYFAGVALYVFEYGQGFDRFFTLCDG